MAAQAFAVADVIREKSPVIKGTLSPYRLLFGSLVRRMTPLCASPNWQCFSDQSADGKSIQNDSMADGKFYEFLLASFRNMAEHLAEGDSAYIFHADTEGLNFRRAFKEAGFHISGVCIWVKNSLLLGRSPYQWQHEPVLFGWLPNGKHKWFADRKQSTIWNFDKPKKSAQHPTMKPIPPLAYPRMKFFSRT